MYASRCRFRRRYPPVQRFRYRPPPWIAVLIGDGINLTGIARVLDLEADNADLQAANTGLRTSNTDVRTSNAALLASNSELAADNTVLRGSGGRQRTG